jgi:hypothetical protein
MELQYKSAPAFKMGVEGRTVTGIFAVHGNIDDGGDRGHPGLFGDFKVDGRRRARFLWQHDSGLPTIATLDDIFEVGRADLPSAVLSYAPEATGGVAVKRTYYDDDFASRVFNAVSKGDIDEMSYAYRPTRYGDWQRDPTTDRMFRDLFQAELYDISDVNWGMNPATAGAGKSRPIALQHESVLAALRDYTDRYKTLAELRAKEGRVLSGENRKRIESAVEAMEQARAALQELLEATDPGKTRPGDLAALYAQYQHLEAQFNGAL